MKRIFLVYIIVLGTYFSGFSQAFQINDLRTLTDQYSFDRSRQLALYGADYAYIEGTPFLNESFVIGEVILNDTIRFVDIPLRYNIFNDRMEFKNERGQVLEIDIAKDGFRFYFEEKEFLMRDYVYDGIKERGVLELMADGNIRLYKKYRMDFRPATQPRGYQEAKPNRFERQRDRFLFAWGDQAPRNFRNRRELINALKKFDPKIEEFIKERRLNLNSEDSLARVVERINN